MAILHVRPAKEASLRAWWWEGTGSCHDSGIPQTKNKASGNHFSKHKLRIPTYGKRSEAGPRPSFAVAGVNLAT